MRLLNVTIGECDGTFPAGKGHVQHSDTLCMYLLAGNWSCITANFIIQREIMHHILQSYVPTALIVTISWFSFWYVFNDTNDQTSVLLQAGRGQRPREGQFMHYDIANVGNAVVSCEAGAATGEYHTVGASTFDQLCCRSLISKRSMCGWVSKHSFCASLHRPLSGTCLTFVFGVMIEFTLVNYWSRRKPPSESRFFGRRRPTTAQEILKQVIAFDHIQLLCSFCFIPVV
jgi:hypothetical protein